MLQAPTSILNEAVSSPLRVSIAYNAKLISASLILLFSLFMTPIALASAFTPNEFLPYCDSSSSKMDQIICMTYFMGYAEGMVGGTYANSLKEDFHISPMVMHEIVNDYVKKNPELGNKRLGKVIFEAMVDAKKVSLRKQMSIRGSNK